MTGAATDAALAKAAALMPEAIAAWSDFLRIPSISAQPDHAGDCRLAAEWVRARLAGLGFAARLHETAGHPVVLATHPGPSTGADVPHLLYYGHYDVQPPEPLELWPSPPFTPTLVDGPRGKRMVARGAVDDKGQVAAWLGAFAAWHAATGTMPVRLTVLLEGEEEIGSPHLEPFLAAERARLVADAAVISDTNLWDFTTPAITTGLRGLLYVEIRARAASRDLHSGLFGGLACNPINELVQALGALRDARGWCRSLGSMTVSRRFQPSRKPPGRRSASMWRRFSAMSGSQPQRARPGVARSSGFGRARPPISTASGAAMPARAQKP